MCLDVNLHQPKRIRFRCDSRAFYYPSQCILKLIICYGFLFKVLEGRAYRLQHPWVGIVNRSQADINKNVDMIIARRREQEYFANSPEYSHLSSKMGSEYLAKLLSKVKSCGLLFLSIRIL